MELTGPYFHNGGTQSLLEVVEFYARGADFWKTNIKDPDPDVGGVPELQGDGRLSVAPAAERFKVTEYRGKSTGSQETQNGISCELAISCSADYYQCHS